MPDITVRRPIDWKSAAQSHVGMVREMNEDSILCLPESHLWVVADGMGGYEAGNIASNMVVKSLESLAPAESLNNLVNRVEDRLIDVNNRIQEYADIMLDGRTLGSTVVSLIIKGRVGICLWAGDSRLYRFRNKNLVQLSRDHSQVEEQIQNGVLTAEQAKNHPDSNVITRAIGASEEIYIDINVFSTQVGDIFLLCSDGLYNQVDEQQMVEILSSLPIDAAVETLIQQALDNGADDNVSIVLVKGEKGLKIKPAAGH